MNLSSVFLAGSAWQDQNENGQREVHVLSPILMLRPKTVPGSCSFGIFFNVTEITSEKSHTMQISVLDPDGNNERIIAKGQIPASDNQESPKDFPIECFGFCATVNAQDVLFNKEGLHKLVFKVDEVEFNYNLPVYKR